MHRNIPSDRPVGSPLARAYGATDPTGQRTAAIALALRRYGLTRVLKANGAPMVAVFDAQGRLLGAVDAKKIQPLAPGKPITKPQSIAKPVAKAPVPTALAPVPAPAAPPAAEAVQKALAIVDNSAATVAQLRWAGDILVRQPGAFNLGLKLRERANFRSGKGRSN